MWSQPGRMLLLLVFVAVAAGFLLSAYLSQLQMCDVHSAICQQLYEWAEADLMDSEEFEEDLYEPPPFNEKWWRRVIEEVQVPQAQQRNRNSLVSVTLPDSKQHFADPTSINNSQERFAFWSFARLEKPSIPIVEGWEQSGNPIDAFVENRLEGDRSGAGRRTNEWALGRRIYLDITGLPPSVDEIIEFADSYSEDSYRQTIENLLSRPSFGEHWASLWLDLARYADSNGYEEDEYKPYAFPFRDFVIWSMNNDLPYNQFVQWQIAGDIIAPDNPLAVAATGFFTNAPVNTFRPQESERFDELADQVSTMGRAMLGLTIGCARCHDHFYDPISQEEYHRLVAIFKDTKRERRFLVPDGGAKYRVIGAPVKSIKDEITEMLLEVQLERNLDTLDLTEDEKALLRQPIDPANQEQARLLASCMRCLDVEARLIEEDDEPLEKDWPRYEKLLAQLEILEPQLLPLPPQGLTLSGNTISSMPILRNGKANLKGRLVGPGLLSALTTGLPDEDYPYWKEWAKTPRPALAYWITDSERGAGSLLARVIVNRIWKNYFGTGLVTTTSDFGENGVRPTHPDLLEWLACELVENNWRLKPIHRLILTSRTYRQSSQVGIVGSSHESRNLEYARQNLIRLPAEVIRDSILKSSNQLNGQMYGRPVFPNIPKEAIYNTQESKEYTWPSYLNDSSDKNRRSIYLVRKRTIPVPLMNLFDQPDGSFSCGNRSRTSLPTQALALLNSEFVVQSAKHLAGQIMNRTSNPDQMVDHAFLSILSRHPDEFEAQISLEFLNSNGQFEDGLADLCHTLFMTNNFMFRE